jgi:hypothetical protein
MTGNGPSGGEKLIREGVKQYLLAPRRGVAATAAGLRPMSTSDMQGLVNRLSGLDVVRVLRSPQSALSPFSVGTDEATDIYVVRMESERAEIVQRTAPPHLIVEEDAFLGYGNSFAALQALPQPVLRATEGIEKKYIKFRVVGEGNTPLPRAVVSLAGDGFPAEGQTDDNGEITLELVVLAGRNAHSLHVRPLNNYWDTYITNPALSDNQVNIIRLKSFAESIPGVGFPDRYRYGWGQRFMGLDLLDDRLTGRGAKVAIVDSGADNRHPLLRHIQQGVDLTNPSNMNTWANDIIGHGSHCAGVITGYSSSQTAFRGFVPEAEIHILKVFPGGQFSSLLDALDYCILHSIDVVNLSLGSSQISQTVEQKIQEAVASGVACIVAAGNSGGPVQYPASSSYVMAVAAVGKLNEFPSQSWANSTVLPTMVAADGIFSPSFTCFGPEVDVCAPGVGIISTVPDNAYEAQSGTSMAAPHITGLAALLIAHHPLFINQFKARNYQRVAALFNLIRSACTPYAFAQGRSGAGLPRLHGLQQILQPSEAQVPFAGPVGVGTGTQVGGPQVGPQGGFSNRPGQYTPFQAAPQEIPQVQLGNVMGNYAVPWGYDPGTMNALYNWLLSQQGGRY